MHCRIELAIIAHQRGDVARQGEIGDTRAPRPVIHRCRAADCGQQGIGGGVGTARDHQIDQFERRHMFARTHRRDGRGKATRTLRHHQREFAGEADAALINQFEIGRGNRDLAGAGHREALITQHRNFAARGQIDCEHPDPPPTAIRDQRNLAGEIIGIGGGVGARGALLGAESLIESGFQRHLLGGCGGQRRCDKRQCRNDPSKQCSFHKAHFAQFILRYGLTIPINATPQR